jgi:hypothetical protein
MVLEFGPHLLEHEMVGVAESDLLEVSLATAGGEQILAVGVVVSQDASDPTADGGQAAAERIVPPSAAPSRPVNFGLDDLALIAACVYFGVW